MYLPAPNAAYLPAIKILYWFRIHCGFTGRFILSPHVQHTFKVREASTIRFKIIHSLKHVILNGTEFETCSVLCNTEYSNDRCVDYSKAKCYVPNWFTAKLNIDPAAIIVAPLFTPSKTFICLGTSSSFGSLWPSLPYPPKPQEKTLFFLSRASCEKRKH